MPSRAWALLPAASSALLLWGAACGPPEHACAAASCPSIGGAYLVSFGVSAPSGGCPSGLGPGVLVLSQNGAAIQGVFGDAALTGTLFTSDQLTLRSTIASTVNLGFTGRVTPPAEGAGGVSYTGTATLSPGLFADAGLQPCVASAPFTAVHP